MFSIHLELSNGSTGTGANGGSGVTLFPIKEATNATGERKSQFILENARDVVRNYGFASGLIDGLGEAHFFIRMFIFPKD